MSSYIDRYYVSETPDVGPLDTDHLFLTIEETPELTSSVCHRYARRKSKIAMEVDVLSTPVRSYEPTEVVRSQEEASHHESGSTTYCSGTPAINRQQEDRTTQQQLEEKSTPSTYSKHECSSTPSTRCHQGDGSASATYRGQEDTSTPANSRRKEDTGTPVACVGHEVTSTPVSYRRHQVNVQLKECDDDCYNDLDSSDLDTVRSPSVQKLCTISDSITPAVCKDDPVTPVREYDGLVKSVCKDEQVTPVREYDVPVTPVCKDDEPVIALCKTTDTTPICEKGDPLTLACTTKEPTPLVCKTDERAVTVNETVEAIRAVNKSDTSVTKTDESVKHMITPNPGTTRKRRKALSLDSTVTKAQEGKRKKSRMSCPLKNINNAFSTPVIERKKTEDLDLSGIIGFVEEDDDDELAAISPVTSRRNSACSSSSSEYDACSFASTAFDDSDSYASSSSSVADSLGIDDDTEEDDVQASVKSSVKRIIKVLDCNSEDEDVPPAILNASGNHNFDLGLDSEEERILREVEEQNAKITKKKKTTSSKRRSKVQKEKTDSEDELPVYRPAPVQTRPITPKAQEVYDKKLKRLQTAVEKFKEKHTRTPTTRASETITDILEEKIKTFPNIGKIFKGVKPHLEIKSGKDRLSQGFIKPLAAMGADVQKRFTKNVTHLVFKDGSRKSFLKGKEMEIHVVSPLWIYESLKACKRLPEKDFPITSIEKYEKEIPILTKRMKKLYGITDKQFLEILKKEREEKSEAVRLQDKENTESSKERTTSAKSKKLSQPSDGVRVGAVVGSTSSDASTSQKSLRTPEPKPSLFSKTPRAKSTPCSRRSIDDFVIERNTPKSRHGTKSNTKVAFSSVTPDEVCSIRRIIKKLGGYKLTESIDSKLNCLVCGKMVGKTRRTLKVLNALTMGHWIVSIDWIYSSLSAEKWLEKEEYEIVDSLPSVRTYRELREKGKEVRLFSGSGNLYIAPNTKPSPQDLEVLIKRCGGEVVKTYKQANITIGKQKSSARSKAIGVNVSEKWVLDSIEYCKVQDVEQYTIQ